MIASPAVRTEVEDGSLIEAAPIVARGLTKHFGEVRALEDLDLTVEGGEIFGFLGPNGAGKTTMIRTILDELRPTAGSASILGFDTHADSVEIRRHIGYLPSDVAMYPELTGRDTLTYFANLRGGVDWDYVAVLAERLKADLEGKVGNLSSGNRQKVGLIQALMNRPQLVIMDEPSAGLDPLVQTELHALLAELAGEGRSVFLSSHTLSEVQRVAHRVGIIRRGRLVALESLAELRSKAMRRIEVRFGGPVDAGTFAGLDGVREATVEGDLATLAFDGRMADLLALLAGRHDVLDIETREADLEEIFLNYYRDSGTG
jgi:ABC-2 type transport system ATP-binding protein